MSIYEGIEYINDLRTVVDSNFSFSKLSQKTIMITGASGLICSGIIDLLLMYNSMRDTKIAIIAAVRDIKKAKQRFGEFPDREALKHLQIVYYDATKPNVLDYNVDYIVHGASNSHPKIISAQPVETMMNNINAMYELLGYARDNSVTNTLFISSSEVYGTKLDDTPFREEEYGYVDILNPRNAYASSKRAGEALCVSFSEEYGIHTNIVRPGHIYGPTALENDSRVSSMFAYDAANGRNIVLKSKGLQLRSYCYVLDCATAILLTLVNGECGKAYNISDSNAIISIHDMAELYAEAGQVKVLYDMPTDIEKSSFNPMDNSSLNSDKLKGLGWNSIFDVNTGILHTVEALKCKFG